MDTKKLLMLINYLRFSASKVVREFLPRVMLMFGSFLWVSLCSFIFDLLGFIIKYISRLNNYATPGENAASVGATHCLSDDHTVQSPCKVLYSDGFEENEKVLNQNRAKTEDSVFKQYELISSQSKYQFLSSKDVSAFIVEPKVFKFTVEEMFVGSNDVGIQNQVTQFQPQENFRVLDESSKNVSKKSDEFVQCFCFEKNVEGPEEEPSVELIILDAENIEITDNSEQNQDFSEELISLKGDKICLSSVEYDDEILNHETSTTSDEREVEKSNKSTEADGGCFEGGTIVCIQGEENYYDGFIELKPYFEDHGDDNVEKVSQENVNKFEGSCEVENIFKERQEFEKNLQKFEENSDKNLGDIDSQEDEFDILQEHKYLVKQMKMDMRYSKVKGLPTISEEFESQKTFMDDLKPLHIDQKLGYKDHMAEIQMFYGRYAEKMKKLDILNYQTLHAISKSLLFLLSKVKCIYCKV
ncbi:hypothetical protein LIER_08281 [Lithospermum erythrorhizon]|uniref:Transmembrane protein n=1 Tax=Lithospermum erythrorhizon TaxID=34254 RepID=A0AAV3PG28_LITER